ncbi:hypothetical protein B0H14DRAFT_575715 [Mycena olivaceomarginata]|nr:hypothetical protein B0H14DRAFT_575715 [Mycena olivaceomarginata]
MRFSLWSFIVDQWSQQPPVLQVDLTGKTVVVGANTGLGFEAAKHFATMTPGRLILACRSQSKGQAALDKLKAETGYAKAELWLIDLAEFESVKQFADRFERDGGRLDILVENAAVGPGPKYEATKDNWEIALQVNHLSTSLLAFLLLPAMIKTAQQHSTTPRLVVVSSDTHYWVKMDKTLSEDPDLLKTLGSAEYCTEKNMKQRYPLSKLFTVFFVRALNARIPPSTPLIVNAVNPGYCYSELRRSLVGLRATINWLMDKALAFSSEVGSRRIVWAALSHQDHPDTLRGEYVSSFAIQEVSDAVLSPEGVKVQDRSWDELVDILGKVDPRVHSIVEKYLSRDISM